MYGSGSGIETVEIFNCHKAVYLEVDVMRDRIYWNGGNVRLYKVSSGRWIDLGRGYIKENWIAWASHHGVEFRDGSFDSRQHCAPSGPRTMSVAGTAA